MRRGACLVTALVALAGAKQSGEPSAPQAIPVWRSDFEDRALRDWTYLGEERFARDGKPGAGWTEAYTITDENPLVGRFSYKGWILGPKGNSHRAYPCQGFQAPSPVVNSWYVWLDVDPSRFREGSWVHFATWCNSKWGPGLHTMSARSRNLNLEMAHCDWKWVGPPGMRRFPLRKWVRFTYYAHYAPAGPGEMLVWMDGRLVFEAKKSHPDPKFQSAHWGMYASGDVDNGVQFNDDIKVWRLPAPWPDRNVEPPSPYGPYVDPNKVASQRKNGRTRRR